jgi:hypothetical protein
MECQWERRTLGTRSMSAQREEAALPKRQTFEVMLDSIILVVRRAIFFISCSVGGPLGGIFKFVELSDGDAVMVEVGIDTKNATPKLNTVHGDVRGCGSPSISPHLSFHDCCHLTKQLARSLCLRSFSRLLTLLYTRGSTL